MATNTPSQRWNSGTQGYYWLTRRKDRIVTHHGIGRRDEFGRLSILELLPTGTRDTTLKSFADGERVVVKDWKPLSARVEIEARAEEVRRRKRPFSILFWNCEHLASEIFNGKASSGQVQLGVLLGSVLCAVLGAAFAAGSRR